MYVYANDRGQSIYTLRHHYITCNIQVMVTNTDIGRLQKRKKSWFSFPFGNPFLKTDSWPENGPIVRLIVEEMYGRVPSIN